MANSNLPKRFIKERQRLLSEPTPGISVSPTEENLRYFKVIILGPLETPYEGGVFELELFLPEKFPWLAPKVRFLTKVYHPNVDKVGRIRIDILEEGWRPLFRISIVLLSVQALLSSPSADIPLSESAAETAKEWTRLYASCNSTIQNDPTFISN